jgi:hypothetical protein
LLARRQQIACLLPQGLADLVDALAGVAGGRCDVLGIAAIGLARLLDTGERLGGRVAQRQRLARQSRAENVRLARALLGMAGEIGGVVAECRR